MRRKLICIVLTVALVNVMFGCQNSDSNTLETTAPMQEETTIADEFADVDKSLLARLMLANERLCLNSNKIDNMSLNLVEDLKTGLGSEYVNFRKVPFNFNSGTCIKRGDTYEWSDFPYYSMIMNFLTDEFESILEDTDFFSEQANVIKENICILDTWVQNSQLKRPSLLNVTEDSETFYSTGNINGGYNVCKRYTNPNASSIYEMYSVSFLNEEDSLSKNYVEYIEDTSIEECSFYNYRMDENHIIEYCSYEFIEKDGNNWTMFWVTNPTEHVYKAYYYIALNDSDISLCYELDYVEDVETSVTLHLIDNVNKTDIPAFDGYRLRVPFSSLKGYTCVKETDKDGTSVRPHPNGGYSTDGNNAKLILANGEELQSGSRYMDEKIYMNNIMIFRNVKPHIYDGYVDFYIDRQDEEKETNYIANLNLYKEFLAKNGLSFTVDTDVWADIMANNKNTGRDIVNTHTVNNMPIKTYEDIENIFAKYRSSLGTYEQMYEGVKNNPTRIPNKFDITKIDFPTIDVTAENAVANANETNVGKVTVKMTDTLLLQKDNEYKVRLAYVQKNEDGLSPYGFSTIFFDDEESKVYDGSGSFEITATFGGFSSEARLTQGEFILAAFVCDKDGIRVCDFQPVTFKSCEESSYGFELETGAKYSCEISSKNNNLVINSVRVN